MGEVAREDMGSRKGVDARMDLKAITDDEGPTAYFESTRPSTLQTKDHHPNDPIPSSKQQETRSPQSLSPSSSSVQNLSTPAPTPATQIPSPVEDQQTDEPPKCDLSYCCICKLGLPASFQTPPTWYDNTQTNENTRSTYRRNALFVIIFFFYSFFILLYCYTFYLFLSNCITNRTLFIFISCGNIVARVSYLSIWCDRYLFILTSSRNITPFSSHKHSPYYLSLVLLYSTSQISSFQFVW